MSCLVASCRVVNCVVCIRIAQPLKGCSRGTLLLGYSLWIKTAPVFLSVFEVLMMGKLEALVKRFKTLGSKSQDLKYWN